MKKCLNSLAMPKKLLVIVLALFLQIDLHQKNILLREDIKSLETQKEYYTVVNDRIRKEIDELTPVNIPFTSYEQIKVECKKLGISSAWIDTLSSIYRIDASYALARFKLETGNGTSRLWLEENNPAGIKCGKEYCFYKTPEEGLEAMFQLMHKYSTEWNLTTVQGQSDLWSETEDTGEIVEIMKGI